MRKFVSGDMTHYLSFWNFHGAFEFSLKAFSENKKSYLLEFVKFSIKFKVKTQLFFIAFYSNFCFTKCLIQLNFSDVYLYGH